MSMGVGILGNVIYNLAVASDGLSLATNIVATVLIGYYVYW
jgi:hypothetical protein